MLTCRCSVTVPDVRHRVPRLVEWGRSWLRVASAAVLHNNNHSKLPLRVNKERFAISCLEKGTEINGQGRGGGLPGSVGATRVECGANLKFEE